MSLRAAATVKRTERAEQIQILDLLASLDLLVPTLNQVSLSLLPGQPVGKHRQRMAQIDHLV